MLENINGDKKKYRQSFGDPCVDCRLTVAQPSGDRRERQVIIRVGGRLRRA